jgi:hypothetical protein
MVEKIHFLANYEFLFAFHQQMTRKSSNEDTQEQEITQFTNGEQFVSNSRVWCSF